ncbi:MAG: DUF4270 domain-containing protein [Bacteroidales bacterium]|nr:DUF4270 domain-containing protein [Bacteroidales bacterium]
MKKLPFFLCFALIMAAIVGSCSSESTIGQSIVQDKLEIVVDSDFSITGSSVATGKVQSRTIAQLMGRFEAKGFGRLESDVVTQFMPSSTLDTTNITLADLDSLVLYLYVADGDLVGDSLTPMGLEIYELTELLPSPIYSDFDPSGYYDPTSAPLASVIYNLSHTSHYQYADTVYASGLEIAATMPMELAERIFQAYKDNPANFSSPTAFAQNVFKGVYLKNSFGSGRLFRSSSTLMSLYYHNTYYDDDLEADTTVYSVGNYLAVTPEIVTNNDISMEVSEELLARAEAGEQVISAPVGLEVQARFPAPEIINAYRSNDADLTVLNTVTMSIPVEEITNDFDITVPTYLLMVLTKEKEDFFASNQLPDNVTSFYATYDSDNFCYSFSSMRSYILDLLDKDEITEEDYTFTLMPVSATFETSSSSYYYYYTTSTLSMITPYMATPTMARLLLDDAKIKLTFSSQTIQK